MADRYIGDGHSFRKIGAPHTYKVGDMVFYSCSNHTVAGEGMFIGRLKAAPDILILIIGATAVETEAEHCAPIGSGFPADGQSRRRAYVKQRPGTLL